MIKIYQKTIKDRRLREIDGFRVGSWIYVEKPNEDEIKLLAEKALLKDSLLRDALDFYEVPRIETEKNAIYVFTRVPYSDRERIFTAPLLIIVAQNFLVTVSGEKLPFLDNFLSARIDFSTTQKTKLFLQLFFQIILAYSNFLTDISRRVRSGGLKLEEITAKNIAELVTFEGVLNDFLAALAPTNTILGNLLSGKFLKLYEEDKELIEDLVLGSGQLIESCKSNLTTMVNIRESYSTIMTYNLNRVIRLLTALTVILAVPTMIASFYGMNVMIPGAHSRDAFFFVLSGTVGVSLILLWIFIKNRWL